MIEGKKREIRYAFQNLGCKVLKLKRISLANLSIQGTNKGDIRLLKKNEVNALKKMLKISTSQH